MNRMVVTYLFVGAALSSFPYVSFCQDHDLGTAAGQPTQAIYRAVLADESKLWIEGDSTLGKFTSYASVIDVDSEIHERRDVSPSLEETLLAAKSKRYKVPHFVVTVPIKKMKSRFIGLSSHLHRALKYGEFPNIVFYMKGYSLEEKSSAEEDTAEKKNAGLFKITADGTLSLGGVTNTVQLVMDADVNTDGRLHSAGSYDVLMTDFGITPPQIFFGQIVVSNKISVSWDLNASAIEDRQKED